MSDWISDVCPSDLRHLAWVPLQRFWADRRASARLEPAPAEPGPLQEVAVCAAPSPNAAVLTAPLPGFVVWAAPLRASGYQNFFPLAQRRRGPRRCREE